MLKCINHEIRRCNYAPHIQIFQQSVAGMVEDPQNFHDHFCDLYEHVVAFSFNQMSERRDIKKHGEAAVLALFKEFAQLHEKRVFRAIKASELSGEQKNALHAINLIKEKRNGVLKGRTCADGRKQRRWYSKEETTSPTMSNDSLMALPTLSAAEKRKIVTWDVEDAYLLADLDGFVLVKSVGQSVDVLCQVDESYKAFVTYKKGKKVLYLQLLKALYGCLRSALLWYELYSTKLQKMGFALNPYDTCVANKIINGKKCSIGYYVDDIVCTHAETKVLKEITALVEREVGKITTTWGKEHVFLGMMITFNEDGTVTICMNEYVTEVLQAFPDKLRSKASSPAKKDLFTIDHSSPRLGKDRSDLFHSLVMKLMWVSQRCRLDRSTTIAFLCTRVTVSTEQDVLTFGAASLEELLNFIDVSFAMHHDMRSHTGGGVSFGRGIFMSMSRKQRINTGSTTESEVVGVSNYVPNTIWMMHFLESQGYKVKRSIVFQDNESAIKLEKYDKKSSSRRTRHFGIRFFNLKDKLREHRI